MKKTKRITTGGLETTTPTNQKGSHLTEIPGSSKCVMLIKAAK